MASQEAHVELDMETRMFATIVYRDGTRSPDFASREAGNDLISDDIQTGKITPTEFDRLGYEVSALKSLCATDREYMMLVGSAIAGAVGCPAVLVVVSRQDGSRDEWAAEKRNAHNN